MSSRAAPGSVAAATAATSLDSIRVPARALATLTASGTSTALATPGPNTEATTFASLSTLRTPRLLSAVATLVEEFAKTLTSFLQSLGGALTSFLQSLGGALTARPFTLR
ncbi:MAG: hypothetical protein AAF196_00525 [Planctomycetota bacterium]